MFILGKGKKVDRIKGVYLHIQRNKANFKAFIVTYSPLYVGKHSTTGVIRRWALGSRKQQMWEMWARSNLLKYKHVANGLMRFSLTVFTLHHYYFQDTQMLLVFNMKCTAEEKLQLHLWIHFDIILCIITKINTQLYVHPRR